MILTVTLNPSIDKLYKMKSLMPNTVMRVSEVHNTAGGKGLNVSRVAAISGEEVTALGFVGGHTGDFFESLIDDTRIQKAFTKVSASTRSCINVYDEQSGKSTEFLEPGCAVTAEEIESLLRTYQQQLSYADVVTISGSVPEGVPQSFYAKLVVLAKEQHVPVIVDTSGALLQQVINAKPTLIKPNTDEIQQILDINITSREDLQQAALKLHESGIPIVAISLGKDGVLVACKEGVYQGITPDIDVVNTVGSGDSMVAGFAVGLARGFSIEQTIQYAVAVSTANTQNAKTGFYLTEDFDRILPLVTVKKLV